MGEPVKPSRGNYKVRHLLVFCWSFIDKGNFLFLLKGGEFRSKWPRALLGDGSIYKPRITPKPLFAVLADSWHKPCRTVLIPDPFVGCYAL